ncbi:MAG: sensor histidine kinase [Candidatus Nanopelagicales bacterium]
MVPQRQVDSLLDRDPDDLPGIPEEVARVLAVLNSASLVVTADGTVIRASSRAVALGLVNRSHVTIPDLVELAAEVSAVGEPREAELKVRRPPLGRELLEVRARAAVISEGVVLILVDDLSDDRRVDAVRRDFVANVSHELKTPVGALSLLAEAIATSPDDVEQVRHFAERMQLEASRLGHLIQEVIDLSRLQGDDPALRAEIVPVDELVVRGIDELRTAANAASIEFVRGEPCDALIYGDRNQLLTALRNLLANAVAYSPPNTRVAIDCRVNGSIIDISVTDQGVGIPASELERIFERFYRVDPARSRVTGGTGLGLAIVKHVCQNHGGECTVWSEVGVGSTFTLRLPAYEETLAGAGHSHEFMVDSVIVPDDSQIMDSVIVPDDSQETPDVNSAINTNPAEVHQ